MGDRGTVLRPLRTITATARDLPSATLHRRLALAGPDDELKEPGDTFDELLGRLGEQSFDSQRQFVANASHELRKPLTLERALLEAAIGNPDATPTSLRGTCERLLIANAEQERPIEALLTLAISERDLEMWEPLDLAELTGAVLDSRRDDATCLDLRVEAVLETAPCMGSPDLVERLVANLFDNALRYNTPGGRVESSLGSTPSAPSSASRTAVSRYPPTGSTTCSDRSSGPNPQRPWAWPRPVYRRRRRQGPSRPHRCPFRHRRRPSGHRKVPDARNRRLHHEVAHIADPSARLRTFLLEAQNLG